MRIAKLKLTAGLAAGFLGVAGMVTVLGVSAQGPGETKDVPTKAAPRPAEVAKKEEPRPNADGRQRAHSLKQLQQILVGCLNYEAATTHFPADVLDKDGKPLLSWRVAILPYIGEEALYKQFKLGEAWDSPHNKTAAATVVKLYTNGHEPTNTKYAMTFFQRPTGKGLIHDLSNPADDKGPAAGSSDAGAGGAPGGEAGGPAVGAAPAGRPRGKVRIGDVYDGLSNTVFVVEAEKAVEWAKPDDLTFDLAKPVELHGLFENVFNCGMADGATRTVAGGLSAVAAKKLLGRGDGEIITDEELAGGGWPHFRPDGTAREAADMLKEIEAATAALKKALDETDKLRADLLKKQGGAKKFGNTGLATHLVELERLLAAEKVKQKQLADELKGVKTVK